MWWLLRIEFCNNFRDFFIFKVIFVLLLKFCNLEMVFWRVIVFVVVVKGNIIDVELLNCIRVIRLWGFVCILVIRRLRVLIIILIFGCFILLLLYIELLVLIIKVKVVEGWFVEIMVLGCNFSIINSFCLGVLVVKNFWWGVMVMLSINF